MGEYDKPERLPTEATPYLAEMAKILRIQGHLLSVGGMSGDRHWLSVVQRMSMNTLRLLVDDENQLYTAEDEPGMDKYEYLMKARRNITEKPLEPPAFQTPTTAESYLTRLRVVYQWAEMASASKVPNGVGTWAELAVGWPVGIMAAMLDPIINKQKVNEQWSKIQNTPKVAEGFIRKFDYNVASRLYDFELPKGE